MFVVILRQNFTKASFYLTNINKYVSLADENKNIQKMTRKKEKVPG